MKTIVMETPTNVTIIDESNAPKAGEGFYYVLGLTGYGKQVYTLYRHGSDGTKTFGINWDSGYRGNMGATLETALENTFKYFSEFSGDTKLIVCEGESKLIVRGQLLQSGKYKGWSIAEVHAHDPNWVRFVVKEIKEGKDWTAKMADWAKAQILEIDREIFNARVAANRATSVSEYIGALKVRQEMTLVCTGCKVYKDPYGNNPDTFLFKFLIGSDVVSAYGDENEYEAGKTYHVKATPVDHKEVVGVKTTRINRISLI